MISSTNLQKLPDITNFIRITQALATMDAIMSPDFEYRYYSFDSMWSDSEQMASMRNGSGDYWFAVITESGVALNGLAHESPLYTQGHPKNWLYGALPKEFNNSLRGEPAFNTDDSTYCIWRLTTDTKWCSGATLESTFIGDGSVEQLSILEGLPSQYLEFAMVYYERKIPVELVSHIYAHSPITQQVVDQINPEATIDLLIQDLTQIGYPHSF